MQIYLILKLIFAIFFLVSTVNAVDYTALKNEYIQNHPGQAIIPFPWETSTSQKVLPFNYTIPAAPANNVSVTASRGQFESGSFIISAQKDVSGIGISVPNLYSSQGNAIPADAINIRLVKVWYQAGEGDMKYTRPDGVLTPELLIKDDSLVKVDYVNKTNFLKVTINGSQHYIEISNPTAAFPLKAQIQDTVSLQPFSLKAKENKQIWLTVHIPNNTPAGTYYGDITLSAPNEIPVKMNFSVSVLPFDLEPPPIEYALFYSGRLPSWPVEGININQNWKTPEQYSLELQNMKEHGVSYPTMYTIRDPPDESTLGAALLLRAQSGLPRDHIYFVGSGPGLTGNSTNESDLNALKTLVTFYKNNASQHGFNDIYIYGMDEKTGAELLSERTAWGAVHDTGAKVFATCYSDAFDVVGSDAFHIVGDLLDLAVMNNQYGRDTTQVAQWHSYGHKIFSYAYPQVGVENPELYRKNYGFTLWNAGYDGAMVWSYQAEYGNSIWNDFDSADTYFRDHVFAYPTSNGVIDTIQWEGWREGVDDTRYLATLKKYGGSDASIRATINDSLSKGENMATIRKKIIDQILISPLPTPTVTPTPPLSGIKLLKIGIYQNGAWYLDYNGNGAWDSGTEKVNNFGTTGFTPLIGDWNGDGMSEIGAYKDGAWYLDYLREGMWTANTKAFSFGAAGFTPVIGDWNGDGRTKIGVYKDGAWYLDYTGEGTWTADTKSYSFGAAGYTPVIGDWNGDGRDKIGVYKDGAWYLDYLGEGTWTADTKSYSFGAAGYTPVIGDWNKDGKTKIGVYKDGTWYLDYLGEGTWTTNTKAYGFGAAGYTPVIGDWNGDGRDTIGVYKDGVWYLDYLGEGTWTANTKAYGFGAAGYTPIIGIWS